MIQYCCTYGLYKTREPQKSARRVLLDLQCKSIRTHLLLGESLILARDAQPQPPAAQKHVLMCLREHTNYWPFLPSNSIQKLQKRLYVHRLLTLATIFLQSISTPQWVGGKIRPWGQGGALVNPHLVLFPSPFRKNMPRSWETAHSWITTSQGKN